MFFVHSVPFHSIMYWLCYIFAHCSTKSFYSWIKWLFLVLFLVDGMVSFTAGKMLAVYTTLFFLFTEWSLQNCMDFKALVFYLSCFPLHVQTKWFSLSSSIGNFTFWIVFLHFWLDAVGSAVYGNILTEENKTWNISETMTPQNDNKTSTSSHTKQKQVKKQQR